MGRARVDVVEGRPHGRRDRRGTRCRKRPCTGGTRSAPSAGADPLPAVLADDGVDEFLWIARHLRGEEPIAFHATDTGNIFSAGPGAPIATATASASDLVLLLYGRVSADDVEVAGDRAALDAFLMPIL